MSSEFVKHVDDIVREEISFLGYEYQRVIVAVEESRGVAVVRLHPPYEDVQIEPPDRDVSDTSFRARVRRRLQESIEAPERPPRPEQE